MKELLFHQGVISSDGGFGGFSFGGRFADGLGRGAAGLAFESPAGFGSGAGCGAAAAGAGACEVHVHLLAGDPAARAAAIRDLDGRH